MPVVQGQGGLDEAGHAGGGRQVAHVALDGAKGAKLLLCLLSKRTNQALHFDGVAHGRGRAVGLHIAEGGRGHARIC